MGRIDGEEVGTESTVGGGVGELSSTVGEITVRPDGQGRGAGQFDDEATGRALEARGVLR